MKVSGECQVNFTGLGSSASFQRDIISGLFPQHQPFSVSPLYLENNTNLHPGPHSCPPGASPDQLSDLHPPSAPGCTVSSFQLPPHWPPFVSCLRARTFCSSAWNARPPPGPSCPSGLSHLTSGRPSPASVLPPLPCCVPSWHVSLCEIISFIYKCLIDL